MKKTIDPIRREYLFFHSRREMARLAAVTIGVGFGTYLFWLGFGNLLESLHPGRLSDLWIFIPSTLVLPLTALGIYRARLAAFLMLGSLALNAVDGLYAMGVPNSVSAMIQFLFFSFPMLPLLTVATLFLFSSSKQGERLPLKGQVWRDGRLPAGPSTK